MRTTQAKVEEAMAEVNRGKPDDRKWILKNFVVFERSGGGYVWASRPYDDHRLENVRWYIGRNGGDLYFYGGRYYVEEVKE